jgi:O-antigen ligase
MIGAALVFGILLFAVATDLVQASWPHAVFRAAACLFCAAILIIRVRREEFRANWSVLALALPAAWGLVQLALNSTVWRFATWQATLQWFAYMALFFAALQLTPLRSYLRVIVWFGGVFSAYAIAQFLTWNRPDEPMMATFLNHNHYAALMELLFPVALWRLFRDRDRPVFVICALAMLVSVTLSGSRAGIVLLLAELVYLGLRTFRKPILIIAGTSLIAAVSVGLMWTRFEKLVTREPYESRSETGRASLRMVQDKPLLGYGLGTWANVYPAYAEVDEGFRLIHADDDWLEWAAEGGLPFVAIMLVLSAFAIRAAWQEPWCAGCVAVLLHGIVEFPMQKQAVWAWFVVLLAIAQMRVNSRIARRKQAS